MSREIRVSGFPSNHNCGLTLDRQATSQYKSQLSEHLHSVGTSNTCELDLWTVPMVRFQWETTFRGLANGRGRCSWPVRLLSRTILIDRHNIYKDDLLDSSRIPGFFLHPLEEGMPFGVTQTSTSNQGRNHLICQRSLMTMCQTNAK